MAQTMTPDKTLEQIRKELRQDYCVNDVFARDESGYDRDARHFEVGFDAAVKLVTERERQKAKVLVEVLRSLAIIYRGVGQTQMSKALAEYKKSIGDEG